MPYEGLGVLHPFSARAWIAPTLGFPEYDGHLYVVAFLPLKR
jgi:hypothetical protein